MTVISRVPYTSMGKPQGNAVAVNAKHIAEAIRRLEEMHNEALARRFTGQITVTIGYVDSVAQKVKDTRDRH